MFTLLRVLIVWRLVKLLVPLAICGLVLLLAMAHTERGHSRGSLHRPVAITREFQRALGPEIVAARRALTAALLSGGHR